ncbi:MAG: hypothetical protein A3J06_02645 [Candidatus Moranbacteria bacterium RIFCSPLOWO2_02_FULL_48_19]|nr:MAG: hypothetical protein A3J06_02645 [Candidatus Moranbacteria bacterium RIFCSPLOWO2_02_FULL_48_19]OGI29743.1 MAG: hypothetical protein A3G09_01640 [Candidatus Moranbacteria bacterium RIFCSPLOWO2_12_FULL_48_12]
MQFEDFIEETRLWWDRYLKFIYDQQRKGNLDSRSGIILYPNILLVTRAKDFFVAELIGAQKTFTSLKLLQHKENSIYRYLNQFDDSEPDPLIRLNGTGNSFRFLCLAQEADFNVVRSRFPFIELFPTRINRVGGKGSVFSFGSDFSSCSVENSVLVNRRENLFRCKNILELFIVKSPISRKELSKLFEQLTNSGEVKGVHTVPSTREESLIISGHLQSMYLFPGLRETTIGKFINTHPEVVKKALKTSHFEYEPYLEWLEHDGTVSDKAINPDLIVRRPDGLYDIYDLKTALLRKKSIVKGPKKRRRFIDYVEEGAAQLANYRDYFQYTKNQQLAKDKYGIEVSNPKLILITGNWDNVSPKEIEEACRRYNKISILDFDTFTHLFIGANQS